jgi:hypothetical protein
MKFINDLIKYIYDTFFNTRRLKNEPENLHIHDFPRDQIKLKFNRPIQIVFGGCGGKYSYYMGFAYVLQHRLDFSNIIFSGASAGSFIALCCSLNLDMKKIFEYHNMEMIDKLNNMYFGPYYNWYKVYSDQILSMLDKEDHKKLNNRFSYSITEFPSLNNEIISQWTSNKDLVNGLVASGFVPIYGKSFVKKYRGKNYIDGAISNKKPLLYKNIPHIYMRIDRYRSFQKNEFFINCDKEYHYKLFNLGVKDALDNFNNFVNSIEE